MSHPRPVIQDSVFEALTILIEECAEVTKEATKAQRFGLHHTYSDATRDAAKFLSRECGQLVGMIDILERAGILDRQEFDLGRAEKPRKLTVWSNLPWSWLQP